VKYRKAVASLLAMAATLAGLTGCHHAHAQAQPPAQDATASDIDAEAVAKLQALVRIDTTNPPGNEAAAVALIAGWLAADGIPSQTYESGPGRVNLVARLKGSGAKKPLLLLNHLDVVLAEPTTWRHPPFAANVADGAIWGRGTLDMKGLGIMELMAFLALKRSGAALDRDVIFCAVADEETGGHYGAKWMLENHPEAVTCGELLNEGGAGMTMSSGATVMGIQTAERGNVWIRVIAKGKPGHGSQDRPDAPTRRLIRALARLETSPRPLEMRPQVRALLQALATSETGLRRWILQNLDNGWLLDWLGPRLVKEQPQLGQMLGSTINTTVLKGGAKVNVIPGEASAEIDIRMLPGHTIEQTVAELKAALDDPELTYEMIDAKIGSESPPDGELFAALQAASRQEYPEAIVCEILTPGGMTDSTFFRARGMKAYGLMPAILSADQLASMHGDDERITLEQLTRGTRVVRNAVMTMVRPRKAAQ
jgi:acetylornithine deacetylase/succinyl-diaminopimelate desuccinylase-like protein